MKKASTLLRQSLLTCCMFICVLGCNTRGKKAPEAAKMYTIVIEQMKFTPADLTVNSGDTVTWLNRDIVSHNITEAANKEWSSSELPTGKKWSLVVRKSADYFCSIHPVMKGSLHIK